MSLTIPQITAKIFLKAEGQREEYCWFYLRESFPNSSETALARWAKMILADVNG